ncbi:hypothetical protein PILCRDRAFT_13374 [Piloderma croceum F 1598]|uniref:Protein kinase domain-containing protein n=1 Tax=Piloderma croceum (strain F 1598) TaxID=765440 RepID=A0A0C3ET78_PILCF|nr:hypothetical protein PILCRDRAFT_13374 [Piloderma croceum F 1598]
MFFKVLSKNLLGLITIIGTPYRWLGGSRKGGTAPFEPTQAVITLQIAPSHYQATISSSNTGHVDSAICLDSCHSFGDETSSSSGLEGNEKITVNIARGSWECHLDGTPFHGQYPDMAVPLSGGHTICKMGNEHEYMECRMCSESRTNIPVYWPIIDHFTLYVFELITGSDYLSDPTDGSRYSKYNDRIAQIIKLMGEIPKFLNFASKYS